jgi:hypothetical protein
LPLGPWLHATCPTCIIRERLRFEAEPLALPPMPTGERRDVLIGAGLVLGICGLYWLARGLGWW